MLSANLKLKLGPNAKEYVKIVGKGEKYKRGSIYFKSKKDTIEIRVEASDPVALLASVTSAIKQLRVVSGVDSLLTNPHAKHK